MPCIDAYADSIASLSVNRPESEFFVKPILIT